MLRTLISLVLCLAALLPLTAQQGSAYVRLEDASGFNTDPYQIELEAAAAALRDSFPAVFQDSFKVYDFGFYLHQETAEGGYPEAMVQKIAEVEALSPYYLLFGKQTDRTGVYTKFWVEVKLPSTGDFECLDDLSDHIREDISFKVQYTANKLHEENGKAASMYHLAEVVAMDTLRSLVAGFVECCDPGVGNRGVNSCNACLLSNDILKFKLGEEYGFLLSEWKVNKINYISFDSLDIDINNSINYSDLYDELIDYFNLLKRRQSNLNWEFTVLEFPIDCVSLLDSLSAIKLDTTGSIKVVLVIDGEDLLTKIYNDNLYLLPETGEGVLHFFNERGKYIRSGYGSYYHGIYFTDHYYPISRNFKKEEKSMSRDDLVAAHSYFYMPDATVEYLKNKYEGAKNSNEVGGLLYLSEGEIGVDFCDWCDVGASSTTLNPELVWEFHKYNNANNKRYIGTWHTHPFDDPIFTKRPSGHDGSGDLLIYKLNSPWYNDFLNVYHDFGNGNVVKYTENVYRLSGGLGVIAHQTGITIYQHLGNHFGPVLKYRSCTPGSTALCSNPSYKCTDDNQHHNGSCFSVIGSTNETEDNPVVLPYNLNNIYPVWGN